MKLREAIDGYIAWKATYTTKAALDYRRPLERFYGFCKRNVEHIRLQDIIGYRMHLKNRGLSDNTVVQHLIVLKNFLKFYREQGVGVVNPAQIIITKNIVVNSHIPITPEDFDKMCGVLSEDSFQDLQKLCCIHLLWYTGLRVAELCELNVVQVSKSEAVIKNRKNPNFRMISWPVETQRYLEKYLNIRSSIRATPALFSGNSPNARDRITPRTIQKWIKELCSRSGIGKKYSPHSFRHGKAHRMRELGADIQDVAMALGHKNINTTPTYLQLSEKETRRRLKRYLK